MIKELAALKQELSRPYCDGFTRLKKRFAELEKSLAGRVDPVRLVMSLADVDQVPDRAPVMLAATVETVVFVVDHRKHAGRRLAVFKVDPLADCAELIEVVSDEVADYVQCNPELIKLVSENC